MKRSGRPRRPKATHSLEGPAAVFPGRYYEKLPGAGRARVLLTPVVGPLASRLLEPAVGRIHVSQVITNVQVGLQSLRRDDGRPFRPSFEPSITT